MMIMLVSFITRVVQDEIRLTKPSVILNFMADDLFGTVSVLPTSADISVTAIPVLQQPPSTIAIAQPGVPAPTDAQIVRALNVLAPTGLSLSDLTPLPALGKLAEQVSDQTPLKPDLGGTSVPSANIDPLLDTAATNQIVSRFERMLRPDTLAPQITVGLLNDTGNSNSDRLTRNSAIQGTVKDNGRVRQVQAQLDNGKAINITSNLRRSGKFYLDRSEMQRLNGGQKLTQGQHTIIILATDMFGNKSKHNFDFTLDTIAPLKPGFALTSTTDTRILGDYKTTLDRATFTGITEANASITLRSGITSQTIQADAAGKFEFANVALKLGNNRFNVTATDAAGNQSSFQKSVARTAIDAGDVVTDWNAATLRAIQASKTAPPIAAYNLALVHGAIFDAVNNIERQFQPYQVTATAPEHTSKVAAAAAAAHDILVKLYPTQTSIFDAQLTSSLARVADGQSETDGVIFGKSIAEKFLTWRENDGSKNVVTYTPGLDPAEWQPTAPGFASPLLPQWPGVKPFAMTTGSQFRPIAPPLIGSDQYTAEYNLTKDIGAFNSTTRTTDQPETAIFWADGGGTYTPPGHWNQIAEQVTVKAGTSLIDNARLFAQLNISLADAGISCWDAKYNYKFCRPITAIRNGADDGNPATTGDATWQPLIVTPPFPEYTSGHSTFSGAAATVLASFFGDNYSFSTNSLGLPGTSRQFAGFSQAADEAGMSRLYGGIHFMSANENGLKAGRDLGGYVINNFLTATQK